MSDTHFVGDVADKKMKHAIADSHTLDTNPELVLTLSLGRNNMVRESSPNLTLNDLKANDFGVAPKLVENSNGQEMINPKEDRFSCKFCDKKFSSAQALGGHQNGHKRERVILKMKQLEADMIASGLGAQFSPYLAMVNHLPFYGSHVYHGANMSSIPWCHYGPGFGNQGLHRRSFSGPQFGMASNSLGESATTTPILNSGNVGLGYELDQVSPFAIDATNRNTSTRADLGGFKGNYYSRN